MPIFQTYEDSWMHPIWQKQKTFNQFYIEGRMLWSGNSQKHSEFWQFLDFKKWKVRRVLRAYWCVRLRGIQDVGSGTNHTVVYSINDPKVTSNIWIEVLLMLPEGHMDLSEFILRIGEHVLPPSKIAVSSLIALYIRSYQLCITSVALSTKPFQI